MRAILILLLCLGCAAPQPGISPCQDDRYLELKDKPLEEMTEAEHRYFVSMQIECEKEHGHGMSPLGVIVVLSLIGFGVGAIANR